MVDIENPNREMFANLEEERNDLIRRVAYLEGEIFRLDDRITIFQERVDELQSQQRATQNELVETQNNFRAQLLRQQRDLEALRALVNEIRNG